MRSISSNFRGGGYASINSVYGICGETAPSQGQDARRRGLKCSGRQVNKCARAGRQEIFNNNFKLCGKE